MMHSESNKSRCRFGGSNRSHGSYESHVSYQKKREPRPAFADRGSLTLAMSYSRTT
jgi:hypothetical protein